MTKSPHSITLEFDIYPLPVIAVQKTADGENYKIGRAEGSMIRALKEYQNVKPKDLRNSVIAVLMEAKTFTEQELQQKMQKNIIERMKQEQDTYNFRLHTMQDIFEIKKNEIEVYNSLFTHHNLGL